MPHPMFYALGLGLGVALGVAVFTYLGMGLLENTRGPSQQYTYERRRPSTNQQQQRPRRRREPADCDKTCTICLDDNPNGLTKILCGHYFHASCMQNLVNNVCPNCRSAI